jgi:uridine kinase
MSAIIASLEDHEIVQAGVFIVAAVVHHYSKRSTAAQFWIPLEGGAQAVYMNASKEGVELGLTVEDYQKGFEALSAGSLDNVELLNLPFSEAKAQFEKQDCPLTVKRITVQNLSHYQCWRLGSYYGLIFTSHAHVRGIWEAVRDGSLTLRELWENVALDVPPVSVGGGGVLVRSRASVFQPEQHFQVLRIALQAYKATALPANGATIPNVDAAFVAESEMRFSRRIYDFASTFATTSAAVEEADDSDDSIRGQVLLVTGPSASGKTTFANRLALALRAYGYGAVTVSMDEYYRDSKLDPHYPKNPDGTPNHELVECLNLEELLSDVDQLLKFEEVELPRFDMVNSKPKPKTGENFVSLSKKSGLRPLVICEGIFAIHPTFVKMLKSQGERLTKVFVMPIPTVGLTELVVAKNQTTRLIRRVSRDFLHRGRNARASIARLPGVQKGENEGIFPLLRHADHVFNTFVDYELGLLSVYVMPLLRQVDPLDSTYAHAQWLLQTLEGVQGVSDRGVGRDSLVREFIGGSLFEMEARTMQMDNRADHLLGKRFSFSSTNHESLSGALRRHGAPLHQRREGGGRRIVDELLNHMSRDAGLEGDSNKSQRQLMEELLAADEVLAVLNNREVVSFNLPTEGSDYFHGVDLRPLALSTPEGIEAYNQTAIVMLHVAVKQVLGHRHRVVVVHRFVEEGDRYCVRIQEGDEVVSVNEAECDAIMKAFVKLSADDVSVDLQFVTPATAVETFLRHHMMYAVSLVESSTRPKILLAMVCGIPSLCLKPLLHTTKLVVASQVTFEPTRVDPSHISPTTPGKKYVEWTFTVGKQHIKKSEELSLAVFEAQRVPINTVASAEVARSRDDASKAHDGLFCLGDVNNSIFRGHASTIVSVDDSLEFKILYSVLRRVESSNARVLFIAGSSSSGKSVISTQMHQLLSAHGYVTSTVATDDYYRNLAEEDYPMFPNGTKNTESVDALKLSLLGEHLRRVVVEGQTVSDAPSFDCGTGTLLSTKKVIRGLPVGKKAVLIVEGLFALSPRLGELLGSGVPSLRVMVHPMPLLNMDELHLVSATKMRLFRRIVRDFHTRGRTAKATLARRQFVQDGEVLNTLPFIDKADMIVNASCVYELSALRGTCEMLLNFVPDSLSDGADAVRCAMQLKDILSWVCAMPESRLPTRRFMQLLVDPDVEE